MGVVKNIDYENFPKQGSFYHKQVNVCFHYNSDRTIRGTVIRDDVDGPGYMIILLEDGRAVLATECQHSLPIED